MRRHKNCNIVRGIKIFNCTKCGDKASNYANGIDMCDRCISEEDICEICGQPLRYQYHC